MDIFDDIENEKEVKEKVISLVTKGFTYSMLDAEINFRMHNFNSRLHNLLADYSFNQLQELSDRIGFFERNERPHGMKHIIGQEGVNHFKKFFYFCTMEKVAAMGLSDHYFIEYTDSGRFHFLINNYIEKQRGEVFMHPDDVAKKFKNPELKKEFFSKFYKGDAYLEIKPSYFSKDHEWIIDHDREKAELYDKNNNMVVSKKLNYSIYNNEPLSKQLENIEIEVFGTEMNHINHRFHILNTHVPTELPSGWMWKREHNDWYVLHDPNDERIVMLNANLSVFKDLTRLETNYYQIKRTNEDVSLEDCREELMYVIEKNIANEALLDFHDDKRYISGLNIEENRPISSLADIDINKEEITNKHDFIDSYKGLIEHDMLEKQELMGCNGFTLRLDKKENSTMSDLKKEQDQKTIMKNLVNEKNQEYKTKQQNKSQSAPNNESKPTQKKKADFNL